MMNERIVEDYFEQINELVKMEAWETLRQLIAIIYDEGYWEGVESNE